MRRFLVVLSLLPLLLNAQEATDSLVFSISTLAFFRDNEYTSELTKGYSLPGAQIRPAFIYDKALGKSGKNDRNIHLEVGAHALLFEGAGKYPCYAYHDIATWKGNQYQRGCHVLPWVRAKAEIGNFTVVMGDIYGGHYHDYSTPLYNHEQILSADPEMGAQIMYSTEGFDSEVYLNWQSYQFEEDTHQEAFTVGVSAVSHTEYKEGTLSFPVRALAQHRGGEQDLISLGLGVQTIGNASVGIRYKKNAEVLPVRNWQVEASLLGCYQQKGELWPFDSGLAYSLEGQMEVCRHLTMKVGDFYAPGNFVSVYGNHFFSTLNSKTNATYKGINTAYAIAEYVYKLSPNYAFGASGEVFKVDNSQLNETNVSFGLFLRFNPTFKIK